MNYFAEPHLPFGELRQRQTKAIPCHVNGVRWRRLATPTELGFVTGTQTTFSMLNEEMIQAIVDFDSSLPALPLDEIIAFLYNVGQNWKRRDYVRRTIYERHLVQYLGYSAEAARNEADWIAMLLASSFRLFDILAVELGAWQLVDDWTLCEEAFVRALPRGLALHLAPSNVTLSVVVSILRAIITKNRSVVKVSAGDPFTATALVQSFADVDPRHPVTTSVSIVYWPTEAADMIGAAMARRVDTVIAWGGQEAVAWASGFAGLRTEVIVFGPKRSLAVIGPEADPRVAAAGVAIDASLYDQRACFSTRQVLVHASVRTAFVDELAAALGAMTRLLPPTASSSDEAAIRALSRAQAGFFGSLERVADGWAIIDDPDQREIRAAHPLGRTIFVSAFEAVEQVYEAVDPEVQTLAVHPWSYGQVLRNECARRGVSRIVECGLSNVFRVGGAHDGIYPLPKLVRFAAMEAPRSQRVKGIHVPIDQLEFLEHDRFLEFVP